jgi:hypothetical protein
MGLIGGTTEEEFVADEEEGVVSAIVEPGALIPRRQIDDNRCIPLIHHRVQYM